MNSEVINLRPEGIDLRLPPENKRELTHEEALQQVRRHLGEEKFVGEKSMHMRGKYAVSHVESNLVREGD